MSMFGGTGTSRTGFDLDTSYDKPVISQNILQIAYNKQGYTDIGDALRYACEDMFVSSKGDRGDVKNYVVLMTDGQSNRGVTQTGVNTCRNNGVTIIAVGIGDGISRTELLSVVQDPNHFINTTYVELYETLPDIVTKSIDCSADISSFIFNWLQQAGMEVLDGVKEGGKQLILKRLGLYEFFSGPTCDKERKPFTPNVGGWNNECPLGTLGMPELPGNMACHFKDTCTGIECCIEIPGLGLTLHPFIIIDPCEYTLNYGLNTINETIQLINYEWGKTEKINLAGGVIQLQLVIKKPAGLKKFIVYLSAKACFEKRCVPDVKIFDGTEIPQPICDLYADYSFKEFSLSEWADRVGTDIKSQLKTEFRTLLLEQLGLDVMLKNPSCNRSDDMYSPAVNGWNNECPAMSPSDLSGPVSCYIPDYCTGIDCCLDFDYLDLHLNFYLYIDTCNYVIRGGIEKFTFEYQLLDYQWGEVKEEKLVEIIRIKYKIERLEEQKKLIIDAELKICLEKEDCSTTVKLFDQQLVSQPLCDMEMTGQLLDISFTDWVKKTGENIGNTLTSAVANKLLDELGLTKFMNSVPCDRYAGIFADSENGWNSKDCPLAVNLPPIETSMTCYIPSYCTGINCCIEVDQIGKTFNVYALLDGCNWRLTLGIERRKIDISLLDYSSEIINNLKSSLDWFHLAVKPILNRGIPLVMQDVYNYVD
ncbi:uncharacterized protein [Mytilus edulis]|uniref:uncharacterized protein n=1 Tax=Mytilus edulis TaxID=6550 RepID=UPI0039EE0A73